MMIVSHLFVVILIRTLYLHYLANPLTLEDLIAQRHTWKNENENK